MSVYAYDCVTFLFDTVYVPCATLLNLIVSWLGALCENVAVNVSVEPQPISPVFVKLI